MGFTGDMKVCGGFILWVGFTGGGIIAFGSGSCTFGVGPNVWLGLFPVGFVVGRFVGGGCTCGWVPNVWPGFVPRGFVVIGFGGPVVVVPGVVVVFADPPGFIGMGFVPGVGVACVPAVVVGNAGIFGPGTFENIGGKPPLGRGGGIGFITGGLPILTVGAPCDPANVGSA